MVLTFSTVVTTLRIEELKYRLEADWVAEGEVVGKKETLRIISRLKPVLYPTNLHLVANSRIVT